MIKVKKIDWKNVRTDEFIQFHTEFYDLVISDLSDEENFMKLFNAIYLPALLRAKESAYKRGKSKFTALIRESDNLRDDIHIAITDIVRGNLRHFDPTIRAHAENVKMILDNYGSGVTEKKAAGQTSVTNAITDLLLEDYYDSAAAVGIVQWVERLKAENKNHQSLIDARNNEYAARTSIVFKDARKDLTEAYANMCGMLNSLVVMDETQKYAKFIKLLNVLIGRVSVVKGKKN